jgi:tRNA(Ile2)-agmatinylcytidine synthase
VGEGWEPISISFDDIDSRLWGCTTHLAGLFLVEASRLSGVDLIDYPLLVRLNPAIPWKTRGNAAVVIRLAVGSEDRARELCETALAMAWDYTEPRRGEPVKQPGVVCVRGYPWRDPRARSLYRRALQDVVTIDEALRVAWLLGARAAGGRGRIGAVAALAALAPGDPFTFELTAYRHPDMWGEPRCIDHERAPAVESRLPPCVFNNYDPYRRRLTAAPGGPDPVLAGFRGTCPEYLGAYASLLCEKPHFWILYRSNQHTDPHAGPLGSIRPYKTGIARLRVVEDPLIFRGGHVVVHARDVETGEHVDLVFYRETGPLNEAARLLKPGDEIEALVNVRPYKSRGRWALTIEKMIVTRIAVDSISVAPRCPKCGRRMKRMGRRGGYRCPRCGYAMKYSKPLIISLPRVLGPGVYHPGEGRLRHLTAPWPPPPQTPVSPPTWELVISTHSNPPVKHPPASTGAHHSSPQASWAPLLPLEHR